jgi:hypothetical protein
VAGRGRDLAIAHFNACHRLQPDNWTYKRQAWSLVGAERVGGAVGRFAQGPLLGEEDDWPFESDFRSEVEALREGSTTRARCDPRAAAFRDASRCWCGPGDGHAGRLVT